MHRNAEITFQDRSWFHASKFPRIPKIEIDFRNIQLAVHQWDAENRVSPLIMQKKSKLFAIIVTVSHILSVFLDHWWIANCSCTKQMPRLSNAHGPKSGYTFEVNASIPLLTWWCCCQDTWYGVSLSLRPQPSTMLQRQLYQYWSHPRIIRHINRRWFVVTKLISMIKQDVHFPSSKICSVYYK